MVHPLSKSSQPGSSFYSSVRQEGISLSKVIAASMSSIPGTHMMEGELTSTCTPWYEHTQRETERQKETERQIPEFLNNNYVSG